MAITKAAKEYHEKMFPEYVSEVAITDPEYIERLDNFTFDEVVNQDDLDDRTRFMAILATLIGCQGIDEFRAIVRRRLFLAARHLQQILLCGDVDFVCPESRDGKGDAVAVF